MQKASFRNDDQMNDEETITKTLTPLRDNTPQYAQQMASNSSSDMVQLETLRLLK